MINELLWVVLGLVTFGAILLFYRLYGKTGLYVFTGFSMILANIQVLKTIQLFGMVATLGNIIYGATFLITDILSELYGKKESKKAVMIGFLSLIVATTIMMICLQFIPDASDFANGALVTIFSIMPRLMLASVVAYLISNYHDIWAFEFWKKKTNGKYLWLRNNASTIVSQFLDSLIFSMIAFWGVFTLPVFIEILVSTYIMKVITAVADTPFIYIAKRLKAKYKID